MLEEVLASNEDIQQLIAEIETSVDAVESDLEADIDRLLQEGDQDVETLEQLCLRHSDVLLKLDHVLAYGTDATTSSDLEKSLLSTGLATEGLSLFYEPTLANDQRWVSCLENIITDIKNKLVGWLSKAAGLVAGIIGKLGGLILGAFRKLGGVFMKIKDIAAGVLGKVRDAITAHPIATLTLAASSVASIPAIVALITRTSLPTSIGLLQGWYATIAKGIGKSGFAKFFRVQFSAAGTKIEKMIPSAKTGTPSALGYTGDKLKSIFGGFMKLFAKGGPLSRSISQIGVWAKSALGFIRSADASVTAGLAARKTAFGKALGFLWKMFKQGFTTPLGLFMTCGGKIASSVKKIKADDVPKPSTPAPNPA